MAWTVRTWLKLFAWGLGGLVVLVALAYGGLVLVSNRMLAATVTLPATVQDIQIPDGNPEAIARGRYLVEHLAGCTDCHGPDFGGRVIVNDFLSGEWWAPNLTAGNGSVTRGFRSADWVRAIRHGVAPDGHRLFLMPSNEFVNFSDGDVGSIIAYVRSLPPVDRPSRGIRLGPVDRLMVATGRITFAFDRIDHTRDRTAATPGPTAAWGKVLATTCSGCHGEGFSGGTIVNGNPVWPPARNLTPDATGTKGWTFDQFSDAFRHGKLPNGTMLSTVMPWQAFSAISDTDAQALYAFFQSLPPRPAGNH